MSCFADCFCWKAAGADDGPSLALLDGDDQHAAPATVHQEEPQAQRRKRRDTVDFETSKAKLNTLMHVLDETPRTRAMAADHIISIGETDSAAESPIPTKLSIPRPAPLAARSPNCSSPAAGEPKRVKTGFSALSALLDESPRTRMAVHEGDAPAEGGADASFIGAMDVSGLVAMDDDEAEPQAAAAEASFCVDMDVTALVDMATATLDESIAATEAGEEDEDGDADVCI